MKKGKLLTSLVVVSLLCISQLFTLTAMAVKLDNLPVINPEGDKLVADEYTRYITEFKQDSATMMITATVQVMHGGDGEQSLSLNGIGIEISFNGTVAPYAYDPLVTTFNVNQLFAGKSVAHDDDFKKLCKPLLTKQGDDDTKTAIFDQFGAQLIERNGGGGMIATKLSSMGSDAELIIAPGQTVSIIEFYFMPVDGATELNIDMFSYEFIYDSGAFIRAATWIGSGSYFLQASGARMPGGASYVASPGAFKLHVRRPVPTVYANNTARTITGYDPATMEWSYSEAGPYTSGAPVVKDEAHTIYVRGKGDADYSGDDELYGAYKKYLPSDGAAAVVFEAKGAKEPEWEPATKNDATGVKIPSNSHAYDVGYGVVFYWDEKQKDEAVLVVPPGFFDSFKSLTIVVNSASEYRKLTVTAPGSYNVTKWTDEKGKVHNINMVWIQSYK